MGFDDEIEAFGAVPFNQDGPVGIVGAERGGNFDPTWELGEHLDGFVFIQAFGEGALGVRLIDDLLVDSELHIDHGLEVAGQLFGSE